MRITTQMLNETARKSGIPIEQTSLLDYINKNENSSDSSSDNSLLSILQSQKTSAATQVSQTKYEKQESAVDELYTQLEAFLEEGSDSIFSKAQASEDTSELCTSIKSFAEKYNTLLSVLGGSSDTLDIFYKQSIADLAKEQSDALSAIGISVSSTGSLSVDSDKLSSASADSLAKALGSESTFTSRLAYVTAKIGENASSNLASIATSYLSDGSLSESYLSKYNFLG